jgi:ketosteroid isomerase-like protein
MKNLSLGLKEYFSCCLLVLVMISNEMSAQSPDEKLVVQAIERLTEVMVKPDSAILAALACDALEYVHSSGTVRNKQGFIDEFMKGWTKMSNPKISNQTITIVGDNAIVRHRLIADAHNPGYPAVIDIIILMVWKKENRQWKLLARQAARLPEQK